MRLIFMGTPDFAVPTLIEIVGRGHEVVAVYTRAPKPGGRAAGPAGRRRSRAKARRLRHSGSDAEDACAPRRPLAEFRAHNADAAVVVAYGLILPKPILDAVPLGCFNLHASLLPRWRGAAPINRAIMAGDAESGVMVMRMEEGLDTGPMAMAERVPIGADTTAGELHDALARLGADLMVRALGALERGTLAAHAAAGRGRHLRRQDRQGRDAHRLGEAVERGARPHPRAVAVSRRVVRAWRASASRCCARHAARALARPARCWTIGSPSRAARARCGSLEVQRAGKQPMKAEEFLRGAKIAPGTRLS